MSTLFSGRLGLAQARVPHTDRHGLLWLSRGNLYVEAGTLHFRAAGSDEFAPGIYSIPYQGISMVLMGPGTTVTHDVLRILARHGTLLAAVGDGGVKFYTAPPIGQGRSNVARSHANLWASEKSRIDIARKMYALRFRSVLPHRDISVLRGMEGARLKESYRIIAQQFDIPWRGRIYDRSDPNSTDLPNQAINHVATFVEAAADIAVAAVGALPPLGFIHEDSSNAFTLDIADLYRTELTLPIAFIIARRVLLDPQLTLERELRFEAARQFRKNRIISKMIAQIKDILGVNDSSSDS